VSATVGWISVAPVKGLRLAPCEEVEVTEDGVPGDRAFFLVDDRNRMVSATRIGPLLSVVPEHDAAARSLALTFPDGSVVSGPVALGDPEDVVFSRSPLRASPVLGAFSGALSEHCGRPLRLFAAPPERPGVDRGRLGAVTLLSVASLEALREQAGEREPVDARRFRMTFGVEGLEAHEEDGWVDGRVHVGDAVVEVLGHVGRCAATTRRPDTGEVDFPTLHHLAAYRNEVPATERLPFGVYARVLQPGRVRLGDTVRVA